MDSVCEYCKAKKIWKGSMAAGRMECPNGCSANLKDLDDGPNYDDDAPDPRAVKPIGGTANRIDTLNISDRAKQILASMFNMMQPWQTSGLPIGLWRITKDPRVCCQALCVFCLSPYDWLSNPSTFRIENSECPSCYSYKQNIKHAQQAAKPVPPGTLTGRTGGNAPSPAPTLPRGVYKENGLFKAICRGCGLPYVINDLYMYDPDMSYCGHTPRCTPLVAPKAVP